MVEHLAGFDAAVVGDAQVVGDEAGRQGMVAGDHDGADAGGFGGGHGGFDLRPRRVNHAHQANDGQVALQRLVLGVSGGCTPIPSTRIPLSAICSLAARNAARATWSSSGTGSPPTQMARLISSMPSTAPLVKAT
jgi:hypothetical protein